MKGANDMTLGEKIATLRKESNYTQEQLADILGVSRQSVSKWESDLAYPETEKLIELGRIFDCSMDYLLKDNVTSKNGEKKLVLSESNKSKLKNAFKISAWIFLSLLIIDVISMLIYLSINGLPH